MNGYEEKLNLIERFLCETDENVFDYAKEMTEELNKKDFNKYLKIAKEYFK